MPVKLCIKNSQIQRRKNHIPYFRLQQNSLMCLTDKIYRYGFLTVMPCDFAISQIALWQVNIMP